MPIGTEPTWRDVTSGESEVYDYNLGAGDGGVDVDNSRVDIVEASFLKVCWFEDNAGSAEAEISFT